MTVKFSGPGACGQAGASDQPQACPGAESNRISLWLFWRLVAAKCLLVRTVVTQGDRLAPSAC